MFTPLPPESLLDRILRKTVTAFLVVETLVLFMIASFVGIISPFMGALSIAGGAGGASGDQITKGWIMILLFMASPFIITGLVLFSAIYLSQRRRPLFVAIVCAIAIILEVVAFFVWPDEISFGILPAVIVIVHLTGIFVAFRMMKQRTALIP